MIIKVYRPDGTPDLSRWQVSCDLPGCGAIENAMGSTDWLIGMWPDMAIYCPICTDELAAILINSALACPCGSADIRLYINDDLTSNHPWHRLVGCADCGLILMTNDTPGDVR